MNGRVEHVERVEGKGMDSRVAAAAEAMAAEERVEGEEGKPRKHRVLLVTSAWHMRRSVLMYRRYAPSLEIIPAAADYEATVNTSHPFCFKDMWPDTNALFANSYIFKEYIGYWGYRLLR